MTMLEMKSVEQIVAVLKRFHARQQAGDPIDKAYQQAIEEVSRQYRVAYQTIGDLCRRRLGLQAIHEFYDLLEKWTLGDPRPLAELLRRHTGVEGRQQIDAFFFEGVAAPAVPVSDNVESISVSLKVSQARKLKAMLLVKGVPVSDWLSRNVSRLIDEEYKGWVAEEAKREV
jgi:hypothetical protein